jgi:hypothetical protein
MQEQGVHPSDNLQPRGYLQVPFKYQEECNKDIEDEKNLLRDLNYPSPHTHRSIHASIGSYPDEFVRINFARCPLGNINIIIPVHTDIMGVDEYLFGLGHRLERTVSSVNGLCTSDIGYYLVVGIKDRNEARPFRSEIR